MIHNFIDGMTNLGTKVVVGLNRSKIWQRMRRIEAILALPRKAKPSGRAASAWYRLLFVVACAAAVESTCPKQLLQLVGVNDSQTGNIPRSPQLVLRVSAFGHEETTNAAITSGGSGQGAMVFCSENTRKEDHKRDGKRDPGTARRNNNSTLRVKSRTMFDGRHQRLPVLGESRRSCGREGGGLSQWPSAMFAEGLSHIATVNFPAFFHSNWGIPDLSSNPGFIKMTWLDYAPDRRSPSVLMNGGQRRRRSTRAHLRVTFAGSTWCSSPIT